MIALLDGDILVYRIGFAADTENESIARWRMDEFIVDMLMDLDVEDYEGYLTGSGNFREQIAVTAPYKGQRSGNKPVHYDFLRSYLKDEWQFTEVCGEEADDAIAIKHTSLGDRSIICSIDKDFDQVPGWHFNFVKRNKYYVTPGDGLRCFYQQILTGDRIDNVIGIRGIGPVKAAKLLEGCVTEQDYFRACVEAYGGAVERVLENGRLLWLRRYEGQSWEPPLSPSELVPESK